MSKAPMDAYKEKQDRLRKAAPDLLAALSSIEARLSALKFAGVPLDNDAQCILAEARTAIAKATGETGDKP